MAVRFSSVYNPSSIIEVKAIVSYLLLFEKAARVTRETSLKPTIAVKRDSVTDEI